MAPEVMQFEKFDEKCDVYSFGIVLWELVTRLRPFSNHKKVQEFVRAVSEDYERPVIPEKTPKVLSTLISRCWSSSPRNRPSFDVILKELYLVLIHVAIPVDWAQDFWHEQLGTEVSVSWSKFALAMMKYLEIEEFDITMIDRPFSRDDRVLSAFRALKLLFVEKTPEDLLTPNRVNLAAFGRVLGYFIGPYTTRDNFLTAILEVIDQPWFYGALSKDEADRLLGLRQERTFLVRFSSQPDSPWLTVSETTKSGSVKHWRIQHDAGKGFWARGRSYDSIQQLLTASHLVTTLPIGSSKYHTSSVSGYYAIDPDKPPTPGDSQMVTEGKRDAFFDDRSIAMGVDVPKPGVNMLNDQDNLE